MSNRSLIELNHDYRPSGHDEIVKWANAMRAYMGSGDPKDLPSGVTWLEMRHHSEPSTFQKRPPAEPSGNAGELAAFEIQRYADGAVDEHLPHVVLVDRNKPIPRSPGGIGCKCEGPFYPIRDDRGAKITFPFPGYTPSVCLCMGVFVWRPDCSAAQPATEQPRIWRTGHPSGPFFAPCDEPGARRLAEIYSMCVQYSTDNGKTWIDGQAEREGE